MLKEGEKTSVKRKSSDESNILKKKPKGKDGGNEKKGKKINEKETAATRRERKKARKMQNPNFNLVHEALKIWEKLRSNKHKLSKDERVKLVDDVLALIKKEDKKLVTLLYAHDTSRVIQCCVKQGNNEQREKIFQELKEHIVNLSKYQYSKNLVRKLLKYGTAEHRAQIIQQFDGQVMKLIKKGSAASVIEFAYNNYANKDQRKFLVHQFYGNSFNVSKSSKESTLEEVLTEQPEKKKIILTDFKERIVPLVDKQIMVHTIVHKALDDFFTFCDDAQLRTELIEVLRESVIHIMHTREGAHVAMQCLWHGTAKDRKVIVKTMKEFLQKLCQEEYGHLVLLAAFDTVDDTVFLKKALITPIVKLIPELINNQYGRKVLLYLVSPRNHSHFLAETRQLLAKGDGNANSKKSLEVRHKELSESMTPGIVSYVVENVKQLVRDRSLFMLVEAVVNCCEGDVVPVLTALNKMLTKPFEPGSKDKTEKLHLIEDPAGHLLVKRLVLHPREKGDQVSYGRSLLEVVDEEDLCSWSACNRGSQVLLSLVECKDVEVSEKAKKMLKRNIKILKSNKSIKSTSILLRKLADSQQ